ncbi:hypothetical protein C0Q70_19726 [Pomacea canaliculata]|uniref:Uncharacterized protein n=1 Tax=Pomacea canaliculata TaxID=400727 RepID=A0A2T7NDI5_POMCA|nr:hypothetical protein C0Q70_19726 [Pomacea canaliculata]
MVSLVLGSWWYDLWLASLVRYRLVAVQAGFSLASNFISMFIAVDRCLCVLFPLHLQRMRISFKHTISVVVIGCVVNCLGIQSLAFMYDVTCAVYVGKTMNTTDVIITPRADERSARAQLFPQLFRVRYLEFKVQGHSGENFVL